MEISKHQREFLEKLKQLCIDYQVESLESFQDQITIVFRDCINEGCLRSVSYENYYTQENSNLAKICFQTIGRL